jgi:HrpA-like RNA helicase
MPGPDEEEERDFDLLPVIEYKNEILQSIANNKVVIIISETGSGKTTQIPQFCADSDLGKHGMVAVTQPRRVAAISVA